LSQDLTSFILQAAWIGGAGAFRYMFTVLICRRKKQERLVEPLQEIMLRPLLSRLELTVVTVPKQISIQEEEKWGNAV
jgi:hypothetical protein